MKIALLSNTAWYLWNFRRGLIQALQANGETIYIVAPIDETIPKLQKIGCQILQIDVSSKGKNPLEEIKVIFRYLKILKEVQPDVILTFTIKPVVYGGLAARYLRMPVVHTITGLGTVFITPGWITRIVRFLYRIALLSAHRIYFQNVDDRKLFADMNIIELGRSEIIPGSGIDIHHFVLGELGSRNQNDGYTIFLFVGRILRDKGIIEYMDAAKAVKRIFRNTRFQVLGPLGTNNSSALNSEDLEPYLTDGVIEYLGQAEDVRPFIDDVDCVVLPSYREGLPRVLLEASAMSKPIIASDVSGCREVVKNGQNGLLCKPKCSTDLAEKMKTILCLSQKEKRIMGTAGRERVVKLFNEEFVVQRYVNTVRSISSR